MRRARNAATCHSSGVSPRGTRSSHHTESATIAEGAQAFHARGVGRNGDYERFTA
jgi:hypothetical protein